MIKYAWLSAFAASTVLYALPFWFESFWWLVFFCFIPFLWAVASRVTRSAHGYAWGVAAWSLQLCGILYGVALQAVGPNIYKVVVVGAIVAYMSLFNALWFFFTEKIIALTGAPHNFTVRLWVWACTLWLYFFVIHTYSLAPFNRCEGYLMTSPLIPLAAHPQLLQLMPTVGAHALLFLLILFSALVTFLLHQRTKIAFCLVVIFAMPWLFCALHVREGAQRPAWLSKVVHVPMMIACSSAESLVHCVGYELQSKLRRNPAIELFIFPESALNTALNDDTFFAALHAQYLHKPVHIMAGSFVWHKNNYHNAFYWAHSGVVQQLFCKRHAMMLIEATPAWCTCAAIADLYWTRERPAITPSQNKRPLLNVTFSDGSTLQCVPYICSELFFSDWPDGEYGNAVIIEMVNDLWAPMAHTRRCMLHTAVYKAIEWQRPILYVSYHYCVYIDVTGTVLYL